MVDIILEYGLSYAPALFAMLAIVIVYSVIVKKIKSFIGEVKDVLNELKENKDNIALKAEMRLLIKENAQLKREMRKAVEKITHVKVEDEQVDKEV